MVYRKRKKKKKKGKTNLSNIIRLVGYDYLTYLDRPYASFFSARTFTDALDITESSLGEYSVGEKAIWREYKNLN